VHNKHVLDDLRHKGAVFVNELADVPAGSVVIFSAHGVPKSVREAARQQNLKVFDATCPLVSKVHMEVERYQKEGRECILVGEAGHQEVVGTLGQYRRADGMGGMYLVESLDDVRKIAVRNPDFLAYVTQTTLSIDDAAEIIGALKARFPKIVGPRQEDICYASQNRQNAVKQLAAECDVILVVGSPNSHNTARLREVSQKCGARAYLVESAGELRQDWTANASTVGVTAGASAPETVVVQVVAQLEAWGADVVTEASGHRETVVFNLPRELAHR